MLHCVLLPLCIILCAIQCKFFGGTGTRQVDRRSLAGAVRWATWRRSMGSQGGCNRRLGPSLGVPPTLLTH